MIKLKIISKQQNHFKSLGLSLDTNNGKISYINEFFISKIKFQALYAFRHWETNANMLGILQGSMNDTNEFGTGLTDPTAKGKQQGVLLMQALKLIKFDHLFVSPLNRTIETATCCPDYINMKHIIKRDALVEFNFGIMEGRDRSWVKENYRTIYDRFCSNDVFAKFEKGESMFDLINRVAEELLYINDNYPNKNLVFCSHGLTLTAMLTLFQVIKPDDEGYIPWRTGTKDYIPNATLLKII